MFSESDLAFLAFVFTVTLGCLMLGGRRRDSHPVRRPNKKKRKRAKCNHCSLNGQNKNKRPPEENDDDESYNSRGTLFRQDIKCYQRKFNFIFLALIALLTCFSLAIFFFFTAIILINLSIKRCSQQQVKTTIK